ncbi:MAG: APC family permease [Mycoplasmataceae bacterium]|nr:APC family permease [Mycoplasmataceae bacterium]
MKKQLTQNKLSLKEFIWFGFNFVVGTTFVSAFAIAANATSYGGNGMGFWVLFVWIIEGLLAGVCAMSFAKMSKYHDASQNGASYVYTRSAFGKMMGIFVGFLQYVYIPFSLSYQIMIFIRGNFSIDFIGSQSVILQNWGAFQDLWMDLISIAAFFVCAIVVMLGMRWFKKLSNATVGVKWFAFILLIVFAVAIACTPSGNSTNGANNIEYWAQNSHLTFEGFIKTFNACFFAFVGFELFATAGKNIQNPQKTVGRGIVVIMIIATCFYTAFTFLFFTTTQKLVEAYNVSIWNSTDITWMPAWLSVVGVIITVLGILGVRTYSYMQKSLFGGTSIQPLANEGFFPDKFSVLNKEKLPIAASKLNLFIIAFISFLWLVVPDIIKGSMLCSEYGMNVSNDDYQRFGVFFNMASFSSFASLIAIFIYMMVLLAALKLSINKKINVNVGEWIAYSITFLALAIIFVYHYYLLINNIVTDLQNSLIPAQQKIKDITGAGIEFFTTIGIVIFFFCWYKWYYGRKIKTRTVSQQKKFDEPFHVLSEQEQKRMMGMN